MNRHGGRCTYVLIASLAMLCAGCPSPPERPPVDNNPKPEINRTDAEIVDTIQANEAKLNQALWSSNVAVVAHITDAKREEHSYNLEGTMLFQRPRNLLINLRPGIGGTVMQVGSNNDEYWAWIEPELSQMWWGRQSNANKPCTRDVFVNPSELVAAMGIGLPSANSGLMGPIRKFGKSSDLLHYARQTDSGAFKLVQEYRVMRTPPYLVDVVIFYDEYGRKAMTASLDDYREAWDGGPLIAHRVSVIWPIENNKLSLEVGSFKNFDESKVKANAFARPTDSPPLPAGVYENIVQVDADCDRPSRSDSTIEPTGWYSDGTPFYGPVHTDEWPGDDAPALRDADVDLDDSTSARPPEAP